MVFNIGFGVCCTTVLSDGGSTSLNQSYIVMASSAATAAGGQSYKICPSSSDVCRIRFDFTVRLRYIVIRDEFNLQLMYMHMIYHAIFHSRHSYWLPHKERLLKPLLAHSPVRFWIQIFSADLHLHFTLCVFNDTFHCLHIYFRCVNWAVCWR